MATLRPSIASGRPRALQPGATWGGGSRVNRYGRAIHRKRGGGGSYSHFWFTIGTCLTTYAVYGRRSHEMKQTQTHAWSLAGEEAVAYSLAREKAAAVTRESGEVAACSLARAVSCTWAAPGQRENREAAAFRRPR